MQPTLSVIVICPSSNKRDSQDLRALNRCLDALVPQLDSSGIEVVAVGHWDGAQQRPTRYEDNQRIRWLSTPATCTVPEMRARGMQDSRGQIVALLEDDCLTSATWCRDTIHAHTASVAAVGGPVEPAPNYSTLDWAVYFSEYARFMTPFSGVVSALPGNNVSYKRAILPDSASNPEFRDVFFHWQLQRSGHELRADPQLAVTNVNHWSGTHVTSMPYHHGRAFAGVRAAGMAEWQRWLVVPVTIALPVLKTKRVADEVLRRQRNIQPFLRSLPLTIVFMLSWSFGELVGYLFGPGNSKSRWT